MRGADGYSENLFSTVRLEDFVPADHPLRPIRAWVNESLTKLSTTFDEAYATDAIGGRPSIAPEKLVRAMLLLPCRAVQSNEVYLTPCTTSASFSSASASDKRYSLGGTTRLPASCGSVHSLQDTKSGLSMTFVDIFEVGGAVMLSLGGASALLFAFSSWLGKVWAERILSREKAKYAEQLEEFKKKLTLETESHKVRLKKSELVFAKEFEAASSLVSLIKDLAPTYSHPQMDWYDACDDMARSFGKTEKLLRNYIRTTGAVLPTEVKKLIAECEGIAAESNFDVIDGNVSESANAAANELYEKLQLAETAMLAQVNKQVTT